MTQKANLLNKKFNMLTVIDGYHDKENYQMIWICKCDCGNIIKTIGAPLKSGRTKSCGCLRTKKLAYGESAFNRLYNTYMRRAKSKNIPFELSKDEFKNITLQNCFYCGIEPKQVTTKGNGRSYGRYVYNGIDRINSSLGYEKSNIVPCCGQCNVAKNNYSYEEFFDWINRLYKNFSLKDREYKELENLKF